MTTSMVKIISKTSTDLSEQLTNMLESYTPRLSDTNQSIVFGDEEEPRTGLVNFIRKNHPIDDVKEFVDHQKIVFNSFSFR